MGKKIKVPVEQLSEETKALFDVLNEERDLAVILIATSFLDACLKSLLEQCLLESGVTEKLLSHSGALGAFSARADLCYALGLIPKSWYRNLCTFAEIRNLIAHHRLNQSFETEEVSSLCSKLETPLKGPMGAGELEGRSRFNIIAAVLANQLLLRALTQAALKPQRPKEPGHHRIVINSPVGSSSET